MRNSQTALAFAKTKHDTSVSMARWWLLRNRGALHRCLGQGGSTVTRITTPEAKKCYNFSLARPQPRAAYCVSLGQPRYYLLLTGIHSLFAPLFTSIRILFRNLTLPHRHDSTKTRNPACLA
jgi:hypothetical protein